MGLDESLGVTASIVADLAAADGVVSGTCVGMLGAVGAVGVHVGTGIGALLESHAVVAAVAKPNPWHQRTHHVATPAVGHRDSARGVVLARVAVGSAADHLEAVGLAQILVLGLATAVLRETV